MGARRRPGRLELLARETTPARSTLLEKVREKRCLIDVPRGSAETTKTKTPNVPLTLLSRRSSSEKQPGGLDSRDPRRERPGELHHLPAAPPEGLGRAHPLLQQHGRPGGEKRLRSLFKEVNLGAIHSIASRARHRLHVL